MKRKLTLLPLGRDGVRHQRAGTAHLVDGDHAEPGAHVLLQALHLVGKMRLCII